MIFQWSVFLQGTSWWKELVSNRCLDVSTVIVGTFRHFICDSRRFFAGCTALWHTAKESDSPDSTSNSNSYVLFLNPLWNLKKKNPENTAFCISLMKHVFIFILAMFFTYLCFEVMCIRKLTEKVKGVDHVTVWRNCW